MSQSRPLGRKARRVHRRHTLNKIGVDALPWPHPRPARDERLVALHFAFIWTAVVQVIFGPPPSTVQGASFGYLATVCFSVLMLVCSLLSLYAAFCRSQYTSFGFEMAGTLGFAGVFAIYTWGAILGITDWFATNTAAFAVALFIGNLLRSVKLIRRLW